MTDTFTVNNSPESPPDAAQPIPPRYWWIKRVALACAILLAALIGLRWWWGAVAEARLQAAIDKYRQAGQPVYPEDFDPQPVSDERNAAKTLREAETAISLTADQETLIAALRDDPSAFPQHLSEIRAVVDANGKSLALLRESRSKPEVDWGERIRSPVVNFLLPALSGQRQLAKLSVAAAIYRHHTGDDAGSVEILRDMQNHADTIGAMPAMLIGHLVAISVSALGASAIEQITPTLQIEDHAESGESTGGPAGRQQVRALIGDLLDETHVRKAWRSAFYGERTYQLDTPQLFCQGKFRIPLGGGGAGRPSLGVQIGAIALGPMIKLDTIRMMESLTALGESVEKLRYPAARKLVPDKSSPRTPVQRFTRLLSELLTPSYSRVLQLHYRALAYRRMAAVALAIRLYELDHGHRPEKLESLVPDYLPALPADPFAEDDRPIGYRPSLDPPVLYSVGPDGVDQGGAFETRPDGNVNWDVKDTPFFLNGDRPHRRPSTAPASTQAADNDQDVEDDEGQADDARHPEREG